MSTPERLGLPELGALVQRWQGLLGLNDWTIRLERVTFRRPFQSGDIKVDPVHKAALLLLSDTPFRNEEETVVHELVHAVLWPLDLAAMDLVEALGPDGSPAREVARSAIFRALEPVTEQLTKALLKVRGHEGVPVWTALEQEAAERIEGAFGAKTPPGSRPD